MNTVKLNARFQNTQLILLKHFTYSLGKRFH